MQTPPRLAQRSAGGLPITLRINLSHEMPAEPVSISPPQPPASCPSLLPAPSPLWTCMVASHVSGLCKYFSCLSLKAGAVLSLTLQDSLNILTLSKAFLKVCAHHCTVNVLQAALLCLVTVINALPPFSECALSGSGNCVFSLFICQHLTQYMVSNRQSIKCLFKE